MLASEPMWAAVLSLPILGESLGLTALFGGCLVFAGAVVSSGACICPAGRARVPSTASIVSNQSLASMISNGLGTPDYRKQMLQPDEWNCESPPSIRRVDEPLTF